MPRPQLKHSSAHELSEHFGRHHNMALQLYYKRVGKSPGPAAAVQDTARAKENIPCAPPREKEEEEVFSCMICKNKVSIQ